MAGLSGDSEEARRLSGQRSAKRWNARYRQSADRANGIGVLMGGDEGCVHHWRIPPPNGPLARGECQGCGGTMVMRNSVGAVSWKDQGDVNKMLADEYGKAAL